MGYNGIERRKHERFKAAIPVTIGLINLKREKTPEVEIRGVTTDISMEGLGLELKYPEAGLYPFGKGFGTMIVGEGREFDMEISLRVGRDTVTGVGEVRWTAAPSRSVIKMGVFLKEIIEGETEGWRDFVMSRSKVGPGNREGLKK